MRFKDEGQVLIKKANTLQKYKVIDQGKVLIKKSIRVTKIQHKTNIPFQQLVIQLIPMYLQPNELVQNQNPP